MIGAYLKTGNGPIEREYFFIKECTHSRVSALECRPKPQTDNIIHILWWSGIIRRCWYLIHDIRESQMAYNIFSEIPKERSIHIRNIILLLDLLQFLGDGDFLIAFLAVEYKSSDSLEFYPFVGRRGLSGMLALRADILDTDH